MSNKLTVKSKDRLRKKRDGTPEKSATPSQDPDENLTPAKQVIWDEDIEKLQAKREDLTKVWPPRPPEMSKPLTQKIVTVKKEKKVSEEDKPKSRMISVAKPAPPDAPVRPVDYSGYAGPRYDEHGRIIEHSLLGTYEDFHREATRRGDLPQDMPTPRRSGADTPTLKYEKKKRRREEVRLTKDDNNALRNWQMKMMERKRQQGYISKLLQKAPEDLAMNQADNFRAVQEKRYLIDRNIPKVDYGKGYRVGSEFWHQQEQFGDDLTGLHMTLTQSQRGYPPPMEHVGLSEVTKGEKGSEWQGQKSPHMNYPWHKSEFLQRRTGQLQPFIEEMVPFQPDFGGLQVMGCNRPYNGLDKEMEEDKAYDELLDSYGGLMVAEPMEEEDMKDGDMTTEELGEKAPVFGPSLLFGGQAARWTGDSFSFKEQVGIEARVTFEAFTENRITSHLELVNDGTTSIYYDWKKLAKENPFDLVTKQVQRFYFNNSSGVILPGETFKVPFVFKSPNAGVFTEQWLLETRPVVCGGAALMVTLRGVALQEDKYKNQREELEKELVQKQARQVASHLLHEIISGIRTPDRCRSPVDAYVTEEDIFCRNNPGLKYSHELVSHLKDLYSQLFEEVKAEDVWSLSVGDLQDSILQIEDDDDKKENLLHQMNAVVAKLSYLPYEPQQQKMRCVGYQLFQDAVDRMVGEAMLIRQTLNLPEREQDDIDGETRLKSSDSRKGRLLDKGKSDVGKDKGKAAAKGQDAKAAKVPSGKPEAKGGKATPAPPPKKTPTPVKAAPTPASVPTDKEGVEGANSNPSSPDLGASIMSEADLTDKENLYKEAITVKMYDILGHMADKMDVIFSTMRDEYGNPT